jgi:hypothetical protein
MRSAASRRSHIRKQPHDANAIFAVQRQEWRRHDNSAIGQGLPKRSGFVPTVGVLNDGLEIGIDPQRIAFYGLSYGGETAVRVPPLLERYCLSICSADYNDWARKVASTDARYSFMFTIEWEMPYFNLGSTFNYAEMAYLMAPRPFMVERGHADGVAPDEWVAYEYAKVRRLYDQLGLGDKTEIEFFNGGHTINGQGTFRFLEKHLK